MPKDIIYTLEAEGKIVRFHVSSKDALLDAMRPAAETLWNLIYPNDIDDRLAEIRKIMEQFYCR
jgi:hypothetical protein